METPDQVLQVGGSQWWSDVCHLAFFGAAVASSWPLPPGDWAQPIGVCQVGAAGPPHFFLNLSALPDEPADL